MPVGWFCFALLHYSKQKGNDKTSTDWHPFCTFCLNHDFQDLKIARMGGGYGLMGMAWYRNQ
jgi:hypothetical protein